jgi:hypothetical protein
MARRSGEPDLQPELCFSRDRPALARIGQRVPPADTVDERDGTRYPTMKRNKQSKRHTKTKEGGINRWCRG